MRIFNLGSMMVIGVAAAMSGCSEPAVVPTSCQNYNHKDGSFKIDYPDGWEVQSGGKDRLAWAKFTSGDGLIKVSTSIAGSLKGSVAQSMMGGATNDVPNELQPVAVVHQDDGKAFQEEEGVVEKDPVVIDTGLGDSRKSEYTYSKTFGGDFHGYRATGLSRDLAIRVICECPEEQWNDLKPFYDKIIESVSVGKPER